MHRFKKNKIQQKYLKQLYTGYYFFSDLPLAHIISLIILIRLLQQTQQTFT